MERIITDTIFREIMEIRREGKFNMLDTTGVQREAYNKNFFDLVLLIEENKQAYVNFIFKGERE